MKVSVQKRSKMIVELKREKPSSEGFYTSPKMKIVGCVNVPFLNQALENFKKYDAIEKHFIKTS